MQQIRVPGNVALLCCCFSSASPSRPLSFLTFLHNKRSVCLNVKTDCPTICVATRSPSASAHGATLHIQYLSITKFRALEDRLHDGSVVDAAWEILDNYNKNDVKGEHQPSLQSCDGLFALAASVVVAVEAAVSQDGRGPLLGICASDASDAIKALREWSTALGCEFLMPQIQDSEHDLKSIPGPVYVKYNPQSQISFLKPYNGTFRGVIAQIGHKQVGHLPLSLFNQEPFLQNQKVQAGGLNYGGLEQE